jgi:hypothetical protein
LQQIRTTPQLISESKDTPNFNIDNVENPQVMFVSEFCQTDDTIVGNKETMTEPLRSDNLKKSAEDVPVASTAPHYDLDSISKLLKVLHVYTSYQLKTDRVIPPPLDYFGKTLLGLTSIAGFGPTLQLSVRSASIYLDVS